MLYFCVHLALQFIQCTGGDWLGLHLIIIYITFKNSIEIVQDGLYRHAEHTMSFSRPPTAPMFDGVHFSGTAAHIPSNSSFVFNQLCPLAAGKSKFSKLWQAGALRSHCPLHILRSLCACPSKVTIFFINRPGKPAKPDIIMFWEFPNQLLLLQNNLMLRGIMSFLQFSVKPFFRATFSA